MRFNSKVRGDLDAFFETMKESAAPQATRLVREEMGCGLRDGEEGVVELPPSLLKSAVHRRFCEERGWNASMTQRGLGVPVTKEGTEQLTVCGWGKFRTCWKEEHPGLRVRPPGRDICDTCHIFQNSFRFISRRRKTAAALTNTLLKAGQHGWAVELQKRWNLWER